MAKFDLYDLLATLVPFSIPAYKVVTSSLVTCNRITSMSECETAAIALGLSDTTVINDGENWDRDPPYCYYEDSSLKYNPGLNTGVCTPSDRCICKLVNMQEPC